MKLSIVEKKRSALRHWERKKENIASDGIQNARKVQGRFAYRGSVYLTQLGENVGTEINKYRPALVISKNNFNRNSGNVTVIPLSKDLIRQSEGSNVTKYQFHYFLFRSRYPWLDYDSNVKIEQVRTVSKARISKHLGNLTNDDMKIIMKKFNDFFN